MTTPNPTSHPHNDIEAWIRYSVKVCILEGKRSKHHRKEHFTVIRPTPLNPNSARPVVKHTSAQMKTNSKPYSSLDLALWLAFTKPVTQQT